MLPVTFARKNTTKVEIGKTIKKVSFIWFNVVLPNKITRFFHLNSKFKKLALTLLIPHIYLKRLRVFVNISVFE